MKWFPKRKMKPDYTEVLARIEKRLGGVEVIQTEILKYVRPPMPSNVYGPSVNESKTVSKYKIG